MDFQPASVLLEPAAFAAGLGVLRIPITVVRARRGLVVAVMAAAAAVAAVAAGGSATGWVPFDVLLLGALGAAAVVAGSRVATWLIMLAALASGAAGIGSAALPLALTAAGLLLVSLLVEAEPLVDAAACGLVGQAALRLTSPGGRGLTALAAALILTPLLVGAASTFDGPVRQWLRRAAIGAGGFVLAGAVLGAVAAVLALGPLRRALAVATATVDATAQTADLQTTAAGLADSGREFGKAERALDSWWARPARAVPIVAQHWRVLRAAAVTGHDLANAGRRALDAPALRDVHVVDGRVPLEQLTAIQPPVADVATRATAALRRLDAARSALLLPPLARKLDTQLHRVRDIERTSVLVNRVLPMVPRLLGADGPRRYFLAVQTPVESRAGGGFMGNFGEITAENGRLTLSRFGRQDDLTHAPGEFDRKLDAPEDFLARYGRFHPERSWANVNLSPDFPTTAGVIASLYPQSSGAPVDGVIAVDPAVLAAMLGVVGPVDVPSWPVPITVDNALQTMLFDQYQRKDSRDQREDFLGDVAQVAWRRLTSGVLPPVPQLLSAFGPAVRAKHLFLSSTRPDEQQLFEDMGAGGALAPVAGDFIGLVTQNAAANKIDYFLRREVDYRARLDPSSGRLQASVKAVLHNDAPAGGLSPVIIGNQVVPPLPDGSNKLYLSFYSPWELVGGSVDGIPVTFEQAKELGRSVYSTTIVIPPKSTVEVELSLTGRLPTAGRYRLDVYRQPTVAPDDVTTALTVDGGWRTENGKREEVTVLRPESDATIEVAVRRR